MFLNVPKKSPRITPLEQRGKNVRSGEGKRGLNRYLHFTLPVIRVLILDAVQS